MVSFEFTMPIVKHHQQIKKKAVFELQYVLSIGNLICMHKYLFFAQDQQ